MPYSRLLQKIVNKTDYNNTQIAEKCKELGVNVDRTYINKLFNGKSKPPKDEISRAIAKVCNADERLLVLEGYIDKAPKEILEMLKHIQLLTNMYALNIFNNFSEINEESLKEFETEINKESIADFILDMLNNKDINILMDKSSFSIYQEKNNFNVNLSTPIALSVPDNAMSPLIPQNSHINLTMQNEYNDGDIIAFKIKGQEQLYVRYIFDNNKKMMFTALNTEFKPITCSREDIIILGKVSKVIYDIQ